MNGKILKRSFVRRKKLNSKVKNKLHCETNLNYSESDEILGLQIFH